MCGQLWRKEDVFGLPVMLEEEVEVTRGEVVLPGQEVPGLGEDLVAMGQVTKVVTREEATRVVAKELG